MLFSLLIAGVLPPETTGEASEWHQTQARTTRGTSMAPEAIETV
jgi:hypothetical protein